MKILIVVGARPNFMKVGPIIAAIAEHNVASFPGTETIQYVLVHTGQHYDDIMSGSFFRDLNLPKPDVHLGVGSGTHAVQTAEIMKQFETVLLTEKPAIVVVVGDVNSTAACALVTAKISFDASGSRPLIAHVEAGLRSFDRSMPEEINRVVTDHVSDLLFVTENSGVENLLNEGIPLNKIDFVGNTMIDSLLAFTEKAEASTILDTLGLRMPKGANGTKSSIARYALLTLHRPSNVDIQDVFQNIIAGLEELASECLLIFPVHPRTRKRIQEFGLELRSARKAPQIRNDAPENGGGGLILTDPLGYLDFLCLMKHAAIVVTDSGGIQEETTCLGVPCVTVRKNTERPVTLESGTNVLAGTSQEGIKHAIREQLRKKDHNGVPKNWDGKAATRIVDHLVRAYFARSSSAGISGASAVSLSR